MANTVAEQCFACLSAETFSGFSLLYNVHLILFSFVKKNLRASALHLDILLLNVQHMAQNNRQSFAYLPISCQYDNEDVGTPMPKASVEIRGLSFPSDEINCSMILALDYSSILTWNFSSCFGILLSRKHIVALLV